MPIGRLNIMHCLFTIIPMLFQLNNMKVAMADVRGCEPYRSIDNLKLSKVRTFDFCGNEERRRMGLEARRVDGTVMNGRFYVSCHDTRRLASSYNETLVHQGYNIYDIKTGENVGHVEMPKQDEVYILRNAYPNPILDELYVVEYNGNIWKVIPSTGRAFVWKRIPIQVAKVEKISAASASGRVILIFNQFHGEAVVYHSDGNWLYNITLPHTDQPSSQEIYHYNHTYADYSYKFLHALETRRGTYVIAEQFPPISRNYTEIDRFGKVISQYKSKPVDGRLFATVADFITADMNEFLYSNDVYDNIFVISKELNSTKMVYDGRNDLYGDYVKDIDYDISTGLLVVERGTIFTTFEIVDEGCQCN